MLQLLWQPQCIIQEKFQCNWWLRQGNYFSTHPIIPIYIYQYMYLIFLINLYCSLFYRKKHMVLTNFQSLQKDQRWRTISYLLHSYSFETLHLLFNRNRSVVVLLTRTTKFGFSQPKLFCSMYKHMTVCKQRSSSSAKLIFCSDISLNMLLLIKITLTINSI